MVVGRLDHFDQDDLSLKKEQLRMISVRWN